MKRKLAPIFKENGPDVPDMRMLNCNALLRPEEVAALVHSSRRRVYPLCEDGTRQQVKVNSFAVHLSDNSSQLGCLRGGQLINSLFQALLANCSYLINGYFGFFSRAGYLQPRSPLGMEF